MTVIQPPSDGLAVMQVFEARFLNFTMGGNDLSDAPSEGWIVLKRSAVPGLLLNLVKVWKVPQGKWTALLSITPKQLGMWQAGENDPDLDKAYPRAKSLLRIHPASQRLIQVHNNPELWPRWFHTPNKAFDELTPIEHIIKYGHETVENYIFYHLSH